MTPTRRAAMTRQTTRQTMRAAALLAALSLTTLTRCEDPAPPPATTPKDPTVLDAKLRFEEIPLGEDVEAMTELRFIPGTDRFLLLRKTGQVLVFALQGDRATRLGQFTVPGVFSGSDCGLISAAFDPGFAQNGYVYFGYCEALGDNVITRHVLDLEDLDRVATSRALILRVQSDQAQKAWHNVGSLDFDAQGHLWALFGEYASDEQAQDTTNLLGTLARVIPNREPDGEGYSPAPGNPLIGTQGHDALYAYGLRSPWRGHLDSAGRFWIGDVGAAKIEEINVVTEPGQDFGWPRSEGPCASGCQGQTDPIIHWDRSLEHPFALEDEQTAPTTRRAVWLGVEHRPPTQGPDPYQGRLKDKVLYGDFCTGWVRAATLRPDHSLRSDISVGNLEGVVSWSQGPDGHLYVVTYGNCQTFPYKPGKLYRAVLRD